MILLISDTPVAGTVSRLAYWIGELSGIKCHALVKRNYPHNAFRLPEGAFGCLANWEQHVTNCIRKANTLILHNLIDEGMLDLIFSVKKTSTCVVYQYHSPPNEPPQLDYAAIKNYQYDFIFAVAQGHSRFIDNAIPVPNVIADFKPPFAIEKSKSIFAPHMRSTSYRWSSKFTDNDKKELVSAQKYMDGLQWIDVKKAFERDVVTNEELLFFLQSISIVIDDINTGLFHQTALEALKAGCVVYSGADLHAIEDFCVAADAPPPPFKRVTGIAEVIKSLIDSSFNSSLEDNRQLSLSYAEEFLGEKRLGQRYYNILKDHVLQ